VSKHGGGAAKKVLCCIEFRGAIQKKERKNNGKEKMIKINK
jgi:hypothetical protein